MATWKKVLPKNYMMTFEVVVKSASRKQFAIIKGELFGEKKLGGKVGNKQSILPAPINRTIYFTPYNQSGSSIRESKIKQQKGTSPDTWILRMEDSSDGDYNDYIVLVSMFDASKLGIETVEEPTITEQAEIVD